MTATLDAHATDEKQRLDLWLWYARFFKTRTLASKICRARKVRIDGTPQQKASATVAPGQVLTFAQGKRIRVVKIVALATRRGPAPEADALYEDLSPEMPAKKRPTTGKAEASSTLSPAPVALRDEGTGRPTKKERRALERLLPDTGE